MSPPRKFPKNLSAASTVQNKSGSCSRRHPCSSGACEFCADKIRNSIIECAANFAHENRQGMEIVFLTLVPQASFAGIGRLRDFDFVNHKRRLKAILSVGGVSWAIGATDYAVCEHAADRYDPGWAPHLHAIAATDDVQTLRASLRSSLSSSDRIPRPFRVTAWDGDVRAISYIFKHRFERRIGYDAAMRVDKRTGEIRLCRHTRHDRLRVNEKRELLRHLHEIGPFGRLVLLGAQLRHTTQGIAIVPCWRRET